MKGSSQINVVTYAQLCMKPLIRVMCNIGIIKTLSVYLFFFHKGKLENIFSLLYSSEVFRLPFSYLYLNGKI